MNKFSSIVIFFQTAVSFIMAIGLLGNALI